MFGKSSYSTNRAAFTGSVDHVFRTEAPHLRSLMHTTACG
ncbi:hypothetical protein [Azospirillum argentinense]